MRMRTLMMMAAVFALLSSVAFAQDIHEAARTGDLIKVRALIEQTPGLAGARDQNGRTPLHWACRGVHPGVVDYLVAHGADANARDNANVTPLHSVSSRGHLDAANALVAAGAGLNARMNDGSTPLHLAASQGHRDLAAFLLEKGRSGRSPGRQAKTRPCMRRPGAGNGMSSTGWPTAFRPVKRRL